MINIEFRSNSCSEFFTIRIGFELSSEILIPNCYAFSCTSIY